MAEIAYSTPAPMALLHTIPANLWPASVHARRAQLARRLRRLEALLDLRDAALAELDALTPDPDLEPHLAAPEHPHHLSAFARRYGDQVFSWCRGGLDDREEEADFEPSLGSREGTLNKGGTDQRRWIVGGGDDLEDEHDGRERELGA